VSRSLEPLSFHDVSSHAFLLGLNVVLVDTEELRDNVVILFVVHEIHLSLDHVFELGVISHLDREVFGLTIFTSLLVVDHPDTFDIEVGLFSEHAHTGKASDRELGVTSLHKSLEQVNEFVVNLSFVTVFVVFEVPVREGVVEFLRLEHLLGFGNTFTSHIFKVNEVSLVIVKDEVGLDILVSFLLLLFLLNNGGNDLDGLDLRLEDRLHGLGSALDNTHNLNEGRLSNDSLEPGSGFTHSFAESSIEHGLEGKNVSVGNDVIGNGNGVSAEVLVVTERRIDSFEVVLASGVGGSEGSGLSILLESEDGHNSGHHVGSSSGDLPLDPLVNLSLLVCV